MRWLSSLVLALSPTIAVAASPFPGGVVDAQGKVAYLASETGIDAIELETGKVLWRSREAFIPLTVSQKRLVALTRQSRNSFALTLFDGATGLGRVYREFDLPRWTREVQWNWHPSAEELTLDWHATARGIVGPPKTAQGRVRLDLSRGQVQIFPLPDPKPPQRLPVQLEKHAVRWYQQIDQVLLAVVAEESPDSTPTKRQQRLVLRSWNLLNNQEAAPRELIRGEYLLCLPDLDGKHLWIRDAARHDDATLPQFWSIFSLLDGHLTARAPVLAGTMSVTRIKTRAYCLSTATAKGMILPGKVRRSHMLYAIDLTTFKTLWSHSLGSPSEWEKFVPGERSLNP